MLCGDQLGDLYAASATHSTVAICKLCIGCRPVFWAAADKMNQLGQGPADSSAAATEGESNNSSSASLAASAETGITATGSSSNSSSTTITANKLGRPYDLLKAAKPLKMCSTYLVPSAVTSMLIVEAFAGTMPAARSIFLNNKDSSLTGNYVSSYVGLEMNQAMVDEGRHDIRGSDLGLGREQVEVICGEVGDLQQHAKVVDFVSQRLSAFSIVRPDCVIVLGGPPCTNYSAAKKNPPATEEELAESDQVVQGFLELYNAVKDVSQAAGLPSYIIMENPVNGQRHRGMLYRRGWSLAVTEHNWCVYDPFNQPKKSTWIFSYLPVIADACCICPYNDCSGKRYSHPASVQGTKGGAKARAAWPLGFVSRMLVLAGVHTRLMTITAPEPAKGGDTKKAGPAAAAAAGAATKAAADALVTAAADLATVAALATAAAAEAQKAASAFADRVEDALEVCVLAGGPPPAA